MKKLLSVAVLLLITILFSGCATTQKSADNSPRFREGRHANVILRFSSWDYTFMTKPFYAEGGYMQQVKRETLGQVLNQYEVERGMAVVVVGWQYNADTLDQLVSDWKSILGGCGFQRVVILRASRNSQLNGSVIIEDASLPQTVASAS
jgi:type IV pilus biogenesis protein CpaD/CtpE